VPDSAVHGPLAAGAYSFIAVYSGDSNYSSSTSPVEPLKVSNASPTLRTTPDLTTVTLGPNPVTLTDTATLEGGFHPTGAIIFELFHNGGSMPVFTQLVSVSGNGTYSTPTGFPLPPTGMATGTYQWDASYSGDVNNNAASDTNSADELVTVGAASPMISTTPSPSTVRLGGRLQDVADLTGGYHPTGSITFRLYAPGVDPTVGPATYTETVPSVNGDATYQTSVGFVPNVTGTWHWVAMYNGDANNTAVSSGPLDEPVSIPEQADLAVTKTVDNPTPIFGMSITYTITVTNLGPDTATNAMVADPLPPGLVLIAAAPSQGTFDAASGVWFVGTLANGASAGLHLTVQTAMDGPIVNNAVARADQFDPDLSNNQATVSVTVERSPDQVSKLFFLASTVLGDLPVQEPSIDPALFPQNEQFVIQLYGDLLHRQADALGLASWCDLLDNGASRLQIVQGFQSSPEYRGDEVDAVYSRLLHRAADPAGRNSFVNFLESGGTVEQLEALIAGSPEYFQRRGGGTNDGFLNALYQDGLGRVVDAGGRATWDQALASGVSRTQVAAQLFSSLEYDLDLVNNDYAAYLRRPADAAGLNDWVAQLLGGVGSDQVLAGLLASDEYFTQVA
jgi:uncharacterized repeat protein (TIGR01451 family)